MKELNVLCLTLSLCTADEPTVGIIGINPENRGVFSYLPDGTKKEAKELTKRVFDILLADLKCKWKGEGLTSETLNGEDMLHKVANLGEF